LILGAFHLKHNEKLFEIESRLIANLESATNYLLADTLLQATPRIDNLDLFNAGSDSVTMKSSLWGIFGLATIRAHKGMFERKRTFFYGSVLPECMNCCIYLANHRRPLSIVGNTKLSGNAYLSEAGVRPAYINQRGYDFTQLIDGKIKKSEENLQGLMAQVYSYILSLFTPGEEDDSDLLATPDSVSQSFEDATLFIKMNGAVYLKNKIMSGHIIIRSDSSIQVATNNRLENVILIAPVIRFDEGFQGTVQAFASDSLLVAPNCQFAYPSTLCLVKKNTANLSPVLQVEENCTVNGFIFSLSSNDDKYKTMVNLKKNSTINGIVYCQGYLSLQANVSGSVLTDYFLYRSPSTVFENHLVDVEINRKTLSPYFGGSIFFESDSVRKIIQWVK
jgi:hypothetical protein